jgi:hypothetical protein
MSDHLARLRIVLSILALGALVACGDGDPGGGDGSGDPDAGTDDEAALVGRYALREVTASLQTTANTPATPMISTTWGLAEIRREAGGLVLEERFCHLDLATPGSPVTAAVPDAQTQSIVVVGPLVRAEGGAPRWRRDPVPTPVGAHLADPDKDALPQSADDPRVWDQDGDGKPGVTTLISGLVSGEVYAVRRERYALTLELGADGHLAGPLADASEQVTIGASSDLLEQPVQIAPDPDASKSHVRLVPVATDLDCAGLMATKDGLFAGT